MKKKVLIIIAIIVAIVIGVVAYFVVSDINQEEKLRTEISEIDTLIEDLNNDAIKQKLDTIVTKGDYAIGEKAYKQYLKDICNNAEKIASILEDDNITKLLTKYLVIYNFFVTFASSKWQRVHWFYENKRFD